MNGPVTSRKEADRADDHTRACGDHPPNRVHRVRRPGPVARYATPAARRSAATGHAAIADARANAHRFDICSEAYRKILVRPGLAPAASAGLAEPRVGTPA